VQSLHTLPYGDGQPGPASTSGRLPVARALGRYRLLERLGSGGFGTVWRAQDERLDRQVAVKRIVLAPGTAPDRVTREALASARLAHPAIVSLYEAASEDGAFYLVSELVRGPTLAELIRRGELTDAEVFAIGRSLCDGLAHAHERGVIHRDVKPHNVLVPEPPGSQPVAAKLADFGGAWIAGEDPLTRTGDVMGTLAYMAPEQAEGAEVGVECDLYSCALVCFEALSGVNPVRGPTPAATARNIGTELPSLHDYRPDLSGRLVAAIDVALDPVADYRGVLADLRVALGAAPETRRRGWLRPRLPGESVAWPTIGWEGDEPPTLDAARVPRRPIPRACAWTAVRPADPAGRAAERHPEARPTPRPGEAVASPVGGSSPLALGAPARLVEGVATAVLVAGALYGLGGATQQAALVAGLLTTVVVALLPRLGWLAAATAVCAWLVAAHAPGSALCVAAAALPVAVLLRRPGPAWPSPALAPLLGLAGLAAAFPAFAGQLATWPRRAAVGGLGYWWLVLAEPLIGRHLWLGASVRTPARVVWAGSINATATETIAPLLTAGVLFGVLLWAAGAAVLPWIVRGRHAAVDVVAATMWTAALAAAAPMIDRGGLSAGPAEAPRGLVLGAVLGGLLAVVARAARGAP